MAQPTHMELLEASRKVDSQLEQQKKATTPVEVILPKDNSELHKSIETDDDPFGANANNLRVAKRIAKESQGKVKTADALTKVLNNPEAAKEAVERAEGKESDEVAKKQDEAAKENASEVKTGSAKVATWKPNA